jgi:hypothetical protein
MLPSVLLLLTLQVKPPARTSVSTQTGRSGDKQSICFPRPAWGGIHHRVVSSDVAVMEEPAIVAATSSGSSTTAAADELVTEKVDMVVQEDPQEEGDVSQKDQDDWSDRDQQRVVAQDGEWAVQLINMSHLSELLLCRGG